MPEGPEVRTVADKLRKHEASTLYNIVLGERAAFQGYNTTNADTLKHLSFPVVITKISTYGKKILFSLSSGQMLVTSLGMTGHFQDIIGTHSHMSFELSDTTLYFDDYRYMGNITLLSAEEINPYFEKLGPDILAAALTTWIDLNTFRDRFRGVKTKNIGNALLEQKRIAGIGNYLKSEILYYAGVHPYRMVKTLSDVEWERIHRCSHEVILVAYSYGGCTIESFINPDGTPGLYSTAVYGKEYDIQGNAVSTDKRTTKTGGRTSYWVTAYQMI
jgi:formamidopyrimidine-DNA glycosylase